MGLSRKKRKKEREKRAKIQAGLTPSSKSLFPLRPTPWRREEWETRYPGLWDRLLQPRNVATHAPAEAARKLAEMEAEAARMMANGPPLGMGQMELIPREPDEILPAEKEKKEALAACEDNEFFKLILVVLHPEYFVEVPAEEQARKKSGGGPTGGSTLTGLAALMAGRFAEAERKAAEGPALAALRLAEREAASGERAALPPIPKKWTDKLREIYPQGTTLYGKVNTPEFQFSFHYTFPSDCAPPYGLRLPDALSPELFTLGEMLTPDRFRPFPEEHVETLWKKMNETTRYKLVIAHRVEKVGSSNALSVEYRPV
jgi:hypothetical protein